MDLDELQSVRDRERQTDKLQQLRETFYADAGEFIQQLRDQRERAAERADDPFDAPEVSRLSDEIDTAEQTVEAIYEKRVGKIVKAASFAAADLPAESDGMTAEEQDLFETLVADIKENRQHVLDVLAGEAVPAIGGDGSEDDPSAEPDPTRDEPSADPADTHAPDAVGDDAGVSAADVMGAGPDSGSSASTPGSQDPTQDSPEPESAADASGGGDSHGQSPREVPPEEPPAQAGSPDPSAGSPDTSTGGGTETDRRESDASTDAGAVPAGHAGSEQAGEEASAEPKLRNDGGTATGVDRETVRITADVGDIFGVDEREYDLSANDVVRLPAANVEPLVERDAAERL